MMIMTLRIDVQPDKRDQVWQTLRTFMGPIQVRPGFIGCHCYQDMERETRLLLMEQWRSEADLSGRIKSEDFKAVLALMDLSDAPPECSIHAVSGSQEMAALAAIRGPQSE
jgi:quinol monooxygenase YgiN